MGVESFQGSWDTLPMEDLANHSRLEVRIAWFSAPNTILLPLCDRMGIRSRQCRISTFELWQSYANTCLVVSYQDDRGNDIDWFAHQAKHRTLQDWAILNGDDPSFERPGRIFVSAYDTAKCKRIMVDGIHRAAVLTRKYRNQREEFPTTVVYEWNGPFLNTVFPCDFCHFYVPEDKTNNTQT